VEYDGAPHLVGEQRKIDVLREEAYRRVGLEYLTVLSEHLRDRHGTAARMRDVRRRARWSPAAGRAWTLEPPPWWVMTTTVARRRSLSAAERERWLRYRRRAG
jgi:hypothetical protein